MTPDEVLRWLPEVLRRSAVEGSPLCALVEVMARLQTPAEEALAELDAAFDPLRTEEAFLPMLAGWLGCRRADAVSAAALRALVAEAARVARTRGTPRSILRRLETATGVPGFQLEESAERAFHLVVIVPAAAEPHLVRVDAIVRDEKPAHLTHELILEVL